MEKDTTQSSESKRQNSNGLIYVNIMKQLFMSRLDSNHATVAVLTLRLWLAESMLWFGAVEWCQVALIHHPCDTKPHLRTLIRDTYVRPSDLKRHAPHIHV